MCHVILMEFLCSCCQGFVAFNVGKTVIIVAFKLLLSPLKVMMKKMKEIGIK